MGPFVNQLGIFWAYWKSVKREAGLCRCHMLPCNTDCRPFTASSPLSSLLLSCRLIT